VGECGVCGREKTSGGVRVGRFLRGGFIFAPGNLHKFNKKAFSGEKRRLLFSL
jgi:hypothetical protein